MKKHLIAFDLDSTVLPKETVLPERTLNALRAAQDAGNILLICSARHWEMTRWVYEKIGCRGPVCLLNGALVINPYDDSFPAWEKTISSEAVRGVLTEVLSKYSPERAYIELNEKCWTLTDNHNSYYAERLKNSVVGRFSIDSIPDTRASRLQIYGKDEAEIANVPLAAAKFPDVRAVSSKNPTDYKCSVVDKNVCKWNAVKYVAERCGVDEENIYAFGDQWNDFEMVKYAAHGYGMLGSSAAEVSRFVTRLTCEEFGVADIIETEILN